MLLTVALGVLAILSSVDGHGRLLEPPGRSSAWRLGFKAPVNYDDDQLYCGGFTTQHNSNEGKCGICGDPWDAAEPRDHEDGGRYGLKKVFRTYKKGETVNVTVEITAHHKGWFEFRIASVEGSGTTQEDLDKQVLFIEESRSTRYLMPVNSTAGLYELQLRLPTDLSCERCVLQWHWWTGNRWDICPDGKGRLGCGPQETFRACSDVSIV